jgi:putative flippase GtrA
MGHMLNVMERVADEKINIAFIIPSLHPGPRIVEILRGLVGLLGTAENGMIRAAVILVDDGSGPDYAARFETASDFPGCVLLRHAVNLGKGRALKTAFNYCLLNFPSLTGVVTLDSDGQHLPSDVVACAREFLRHPDALVLGARNFKNPGVPFKSRYGNRATRWMFRFVSGIDVLDTQTGLRCIPASFLRRLMNVPGERFNFEMNMLMECKAARVPVAEIPIETVYIEGNKATYFNPFLDSMRIYAIFLKYIVSGVSSMALDMSVFSAILYLIKPLSISNYVMISTVAARIVSSLYNYFLNKKFVFAGGRGLSSIARYYSLAAFQMLLSGLLVGLLSHAASSLVVGFKLFVDSLLFAASFWVQQKWVFRKTTGFK